MENRDGRDEGINVRHNKISLITPHTSDRSAITEDPQHVIGAHTDSVVKRRKLSYLDNNTRDFT